MNPLTFTDAALIHLQDMLKNHPNGCGFRLSIKKKGCSGFAYVPTIVTEASPNDIHFVAQNGVPIFIDPDCLSYVNNVVVDYLVDDKSGLKQKKLVFINPQETGRCGCGESFTVGNKDA